MNKESINILLVDDDPGDRKLVELILYKPDQPVDFSVETVDSLSSAIDCLEKKDFDVVLLDLGLPDSTGINTVQKLYRIIPEIPIIVLTGLSVKEMGVLSIKKGAADYLPKDKYLKYRLVNSIRYAFERWQMKKELAETTNLFQSIMDSATEVIIIATDQAGNIVSWNEGARKLLGYRSEEVVGKEQVSIFHTKEYLEAGTMEPNIKNIMSTRKPLVEELTYVAKSGKTFPVHQIVTPRYNEDGKFIGMLGLAQDITEQKKTEEKISKSEHIWRESFDSIDDIIMILDKDNNIENINRKGLELLGKSREEAIGRKCYECIHGVEKPQEYCPISDVLITKKVESTELDDPIYGRYFEIKCSPILNEKGEIIKYVELMIDITERKRIQDELMESEEKFRKISSSAPDAIIMMNIKGRITFWNEAAETIFGYGKDEVMGKDLHKLIVPKKYHGDVKRGFKKLRETGKADIIGRSFEFDAINKKGNEFPVEISISSVDVKGEWNAISIIRDKTEQKIYEKALQESEEKHRSLIETTSEGYWLLNKEMKIIDVNKALCDMLGYSRQGIIGKSPSDFMNEKSHKFFLSQKAKAPYTKHRNYENAFKKKTGETAHTYISATTIRDASGKFQGSFALISDITKLENTQSELQKAKEEAERMSRVKSEFLANMSHEIRTPMNSILGFIELLDNSTIDQQQKKYLSIIDRSSKVLLEIINDILDFSRIESGKIVIENIEFTLKEELEPLVDLFSARSNEKNVKLLSFIDPDLPEFVLGDPLRIKQVLTNLISNAIKFTPENGQIFIEVKPIGFSGKSCSIHFSVSDTGIGIPENMKHTIFKAFSQGDSTVTRKYGGTGLGLAISYNLVNLMGGTLQFESEEAKGSRFHFDLNFDECKTEKPDYRLLDIKDVNCLLFRCSSGDNLQMLIVERYLESLRLKTRTFTGKEELKRILSGGNNIFCMEYSSLIIDDFNNVLMEYPDIPIIIIANEWEKDRIISPGERITRVLFQPVNASKILNAVIEIVHGDIVNHQAIVEEKHLTGIVFNAKALVAEDNDVNQQLITIMLNNLGIEVDIAPNGREAVEKFQKNKYDIILMDVNMPVMDGIRATKIILKIEKQNETAHTPIVALTAKAIRGDRENLIDKGMDDYLSKPIDTNRLRKTLQKYLLLKRKKEKHNHTPDDKKESTYDLEKTAGELGIGVDTMRKIVEKFLSGADEYIRNLSEGIKNLDYEKICKEAHKLSGTASNLRLNRLASICSEIEGNAENSNEIDYNKLLNMIRKEFASLKKIILKR